MLHPELRNSLYFLANSVSSAQIFSLNKQKKENRLAVLHSNVALLFFLKSGLQLKHIKAICVHLTAQKYLLTSSSGLSAACLFLYNFIVKDDNQNSSLKS